MFQVDHLCVCASGAVWASSHTLCPRSFFLCHQLTFVARQPSGRKEGGGVGPILSLIPYYGVALNFGEMEAEDRLFLVT